MIDFIGATTDRKGIWCSVEVLAYRRVAADRNSASRIEELWAGKSAGGEAGSSENTRKKSKPEDQKKDSRLCSWSPVGTATASRKVDAVDDEKDGQLHIYPWLVLDWYWRCSAACKRLRSTITPRESRPTHNSRPSPTGRVSSMDKRKRLGLQSETMH